jgi:GMP synthase (glutamine-hydrolysing)
MTVTQNLDKILVLDFGSQYTQLIARRIREQKVYCEIHPFNYSVDKINKFNPQGIILSGGPSNVYADNAPACSKELFELNIPVLGICYGLQLMCFMLGGKVKPHTKREYGKALINVHCNEGIFSGINSANPLTVWMSHGDRVEKLPENFEKIASSANSPFAAIANKNRQFYGVQFHPEVLHTPAGIEILRNFIFTVCQCRPNWTMQNFIEFQIQNIKNTVGNRNIICALSGGVDSSVTATLINKALDNRLRCIFVNNGLLRKDEHNKIVRIFRDEMKLNLTYVDAEDRFLKKLEGITDPEEKRQIIGHEFIKIFEEEASKVENVEFLAQGTLYPDVIESVSFKGPSATIKSHHNVGCLPEKMNLKLVEPFRELFKDEVRILGKELGLPDEIIQRQPFPGPGLAIRIVGAVNRERLNILREADDIVVGEIKRAGLYTKVWQSFAVLLPVKSVGVMGDERTYENVLALRIVESKDGMTADWVDVPYEILGTISNRLINEINGVNRVVYDISSKPPGTIEWE